MTASSDIGPTSARQKPVAWLPLLCLLGGGALLGMSINLAKLAGEMGLSPLAFLCWSTVGAASLLMALAAWRGDLLTVSARTLEYYGVSALVGMVACNLIFFSAVPHVGAGFIALIISLPPLLTYLGTLALRLEPWPALRALGVAAALMGVHAPVFAGMFFLLFLLQKSGGSVVLSLLGAVGAVVGVPVTVFLQGEAPAGGLWLGTGLIAVGVALVSLGRHPFLLPIPLNQILPNLP